MGNQFSTFQQCSYTPNDLRKALRQAGIVSGKTAILHMALFDLGHMVDNQDDPLQIWIDLLLEAVGPQGAIILPAFTYSYCKNKVYDPHKSLSTVNLLANHAIVTKQGYRTLDPIFSYVILPSSPQVAEKVASYQFSNICFAKTNSVIGLACELCEQPLIGEIKSNQRGTDSLTIGHAVQQEIQIPQRFIKKFTGITRINGKEQQTECHYFCRISVPNTEIDPSKIHPIKECITPLGAGGFEIFELKTYWENYRNELISDPWVYQRGPALSMEQIQTLLAQEQVEDINAIKPVFSLPVKL